MHNFFMQAASCLAETSPSQKVKQTFDLFAENQQGGLGFEQTTIDIIRGVPPQPILVAQSELPARKFNGISGHGAMIHAIAHIEFSAINLALDALVRFQRMPQDYYHDWLKVAKEECEHFMLLTTRLEKTGFSYGDFPAHDGLWLAATETAHDVLLRMAVVPRLLEARGLDVTPGIIKKFQAIGDDEMVKALDIIFREEITHVAIGTRWFNYICQERGLDSEKTFIRLLATEYKGKLNKPSAIAERKEAGFSEGEIAWLQSH